MQETRKRGPKSKAAPKIIKTPDMSDRSHVFFYAFRNPSMQVQYRYLVGVSFVTVISPKRRHYKDYRSRKSVAQGHRVMLAKGAKSKKGQKANKDFTSNRVCFPSFSFCSVVASKQKPLSAKHESTDSVDDEHVGRRSEL
jgi:hypothetical protein